MLRWRAVKHWEAEVYTLKCENRCLSRLMIDNAHYLPCGMCPVMRLLGRSYSLLKQKSSRAYVMSHGLVLIPGFIFYCCSGCRGLCSHLARVLWLWAWPALSQPSIHTPRAGPETGTLSDESVVCLVLSFLLLVLPCRPHSVDHWAAGECPTQTRNDRQIFQGFFHQER